MERARAAAAGAAAAGAALAAGQIPSAIAGESTSLVTAVGDEFVDAFAGSLEDVAIALFGTSDKVALVAGIVAVSLAIGAGVGVLAARRRAAGDLAFAAFGAIGLWAGLRSPTATGAVVVVSVIAAVATGVVVLRGLLRLADTSLEPEPDVGGRRVRVVDRRAFLAWTAGAGAASAVGATAAHALRDRAGAAKARAAIALPAATVKEPVPPAPGLDVPGLSPYVTPNDAFYRIDTALATPHVDAGSWRLRIGGYVDRPFELSYDDVLAMDLVEETVTIACVSNEVGGDLVGNAVWLGVPLAELLDRARVQRRGTQVLSRSVDGFTAGFPTAAVDGRTALLAVGMNGEPLPFGHGYPARLVVAGLYGYVSATKWLEEIELTSFDDVDGYWIPRGWAKEAPVKTQSRIDVPRGGSVAPGRVTVAGVAWAPGRGIAKVELQVDGGEWRACELGPAVDGDTWVQWSTAWDAPAGEHSLRVRATDANGHTQTPDRAPPRPDGATGWHTRNVVVR